jgi:hypothetical protein
MTKVIQKGKPARNLSDNGEVYDLQYSRKVCVDEHTSDIELTVLGSLPLHSVVATSTLPTYDEVSYNPKKGTFKTKQVRVSADDAIVRNAERHQGRLSAHMVTGHCPDAKHEKATNAAYPSPPMGSQFSITNRKKGF